VRRKRDIERELAFSEAKVESLTEQLRAVQDEKLELKRVVQDEKLELKAQIDKLQDALISVRAPAAYLDQQDEKYEANRPKISEETLEKNRVFKEVQELYINQMEGTLLKTPEDLDDLLISGIISEHKPPASLHGNSES
jgi:chromosome segregation ATPase